MLDKEFLERLYGLYNRKKYVHPDPLEFLYRYDDPADREIAGLIASSLAYGRVAQILKSVEKALAPLGDHPAKKLQDLTPSRMRAAYRGFKHRFTTDEDLVAMLLGARNAVKKHGSLGKILKSHISLGDNTILPALGSFVEEVCGGGSYLLPSPSDGSACKRVNLYLRWMVRKDKVDPGGWKGIPKRLLIVPVDVHVANISREFGITQRKTAGMAMAVEITDYFRKISPDDPVKYDFSLTRFGIHPDMSRRDLHSLRGEG
jgi:uncharacterized protein (TIGR02757 family)